MQRPPALIAARLPIAEQSTAKRTSVFPKATRDLSPYPPQYEEDDIHYLINNLRNTYERNSWDKRYKLFMHIADFYAMWLSDKKQLWSIEQNIRLFKANLEECEIGLRKKEEDLRSGTKNK